MKLFWKIFLTTITVFVLAFASVFYFSVTSQIRETENNIMEQYQTTGSFLTKEIEVGYLESRWPFENLKQLAQRKDFLFWWIIKEDGSIYLADKSSFMGTKAVSYFPEMEKGTKEEDIVLNRSKNYGIYTKTFTVGQTKWMFWLGFSLKDITNQRNAIILSSILISFLAELAVGIALYFIVTHFTKPISELVTGTNKVAEGNLDYQLSASSDDELGVLASGFNSMTAKLKTSYSDLENKVKLRTEELNQKLDELERMNKLMVGRELKMTEMKNEIEELKKKTGS
jgi:methyl-accepting chemotaxis protein